MKLETTTRQSWTILTLHGRFDAHVTPQVTSWITEQLAADRRWLLVNLGDVHFVDSSALASLVQGMKRARQSDGDLRLCCLQQPVRIIFELTRLDRAFKMYDTEQAAVSSHIPDNGA